MLANTAFLSKGSCLAAQPLPSSISSQQLRGFASDLLHVSLRRKQEGAVTADEGLCPPSSRVTSASHSLGTAMSVTKLSALSAPPPATFKRLLQMPLLLTTPGSHTEHGVWINTQQVYEGACVSLRAMIANDLWLGSSLPRGQATLSHPRNMAVQMLDSKPVGRKNHEGQERDCSILHLAFLPDLNPSTSARSEWSWPLVSPEHKKNEETRRRPSVPELRC